MTKFLNKYWPILVFALATFVYFWKVFLKGYVPIPADLMVGAYLPWLEDKWGFPTGVPVKNPLISDIFSQFYMWKSLIGESWRNMQIPLWNPYSYSGYPLLANFHSGVFYPLNLGLVFFGDIIGWDILVILPSFATALTMYLYLQHIKVNKVGAVSGGLIYAYSGFAISWAQFVTAAHAMIWMPLVFLTIEKYFDTKKKTYLYYLPILFFLLVTSGHFQILVYMTLLTAVYFLWKWSERKEVSALVDAVIPGVLALGLSACQILPTLEMTNLGLRSVENYIKDYNYGLLPMKYWVTLIAPDFFGNAATGNFFGSFNYHEAIVYTGVVSVFSFFLSLFLFKNNKYVRFFAITTIVSFLLAFDTFLGKALYEYNTPGLSTSAAGRVAVIFSMGLAVLTGIVLSNLEKINIKKKIFVVLLVIASFGVMYYLAKSTDSILLSDTNVGFTLDQRRMVALRNLILPGGLVLAFSILLLAAKKWRVAYAGIVALTCLEMFRFGWKYIPFVPTNIVYPTTPGIEFLQSEGRGEVFRIDRERAEILPPATWMQYRLQSPSGYDPMALREYAAIYEEEINRDDNKHVGRYSELERYDASALGKFNVKYLMVTKRDNVGKLGGDNINHTIDQKEWIKVFETPATAILENTKYLPRARYLDDGQSEIEITKYTPNTVRIQFSNGKDRTLVLADTYYPGWKALVNGSEVQIEKCEGVFRCVKLSDDSGELVFDYQPESFWNGVKISLTSLLVLVGIFIYLRRTERNT